MSKDTHRHTHRQTQINTNKHRHTQGVESPLHVCQHPTQAAVSHLAREFAQHSADLALRELQRRTRRHKQVDDAELRVEDGVHQGGAAKPAAGVWEGRRREGGGGVWGKGGGGEESRSIEEKEDNNKRKRGKGSSFTPTHPPTHTHTHTHNQTCPQRARRRPAAGGSARPPCDPRRTRGAVPIACRSPHRQAAGRAPVCRHAGTTQPHSRRHRYTKETSECYVMVFRKGERHNRRRLLTSSDWSRSVLPSAAALHSSAGQIFRGRTASDLSSLPWLCQRRAASMSGGVCSM